MTENNQTMSLEDITRALTEIAQHVDAIRGGESAPELDPNDPLNKVLPDNHVAYDAEGADDARMNRTLASSGEPRTIRNVLQAYVKSPAPDGWYTLRSGDNRYRIARAYRLRVTSPVGITKTVVVVCDFGLPLRNSEELSAGWVIEDTPEGPVKVLDVYEHAGEQYLIYEMPDC